FPEAGVLLGDIAAERGQHGAGHSERENGRAAAESGAEERRVEALATRVIVVPGAEIEGELVEGRADTAVEVDSRSRIVREVDALAGNAAVALPVGVPVVAQLEAGLSGRLVVGLSDAAEIIVGH